MIGATLFVKNGYLCIELLDEETKKIEFHKFKADIIDYEALNKFNGKKIEQW